ncbi:cation:proton antiporter [Methanobacterium ferruginis]|jgi:Kef-type K+ transport system membrane component KefB|uniref:cation:proton antiporter n=1 Tax=Methanobacterium ferruginis TaxID=710191 RepID=UPI0025738BD8|nr:cation:proton antiporter [Methanobacterium ferruginis]BDZ67105.1 potassium transporter Kef [Methanobacterium ferruginis]
MYADISPLILGFIILFASLISLRFGISVAILEIIFGVIVGNIFNISPEGWMIYISSFGGIFLTFLAGAETDIKLMRSKFKESFLIGLASFLIPFITVFLFSYYLANWSLLASLIAGVTLSETAVAVVYFVLIETDLANTEIGKTIMAATFMTNMGTAIALSVLFVNFNLYTLIFLIVSFLVILFGYKYSRLIFDNVRFKNKVIEPEIKYVFLLLLVFMFFAQLGGGQAILPAFILGIFMSQHFVESKESIEVKKRLKTVAFAFITPIFFIVGGLKVSLALIAMALPSFIGLLVVRQLSKLTGVYLVTRKYLDTAQTYTTLLMSTGLTFGLIASVFGLNAGYIDQIQYSLLTGVLITSAVIPTLIAQKWFFPFHQEDMLDQ